MMFHNNSSILCTRRFNYFSFLLKGKTQTLERVKIKKSRIGGNFRLSMIITRLNSLIRNLFFP